MPTQILILGDVALQCHVQVGSFSHDELDTNVIVRLLASKAEMCFPKIEWVEHEY